MIQNIIITNKIDKNKSIENSYNFTGLADNIFQIHESLRNYNDKAINISINCVN
jgi:hypothetical protein